MIEKFSDFDEMQPGTIFTKNKKGKYKILRPSKEINDFKDKINKFCKSIGIKSTAHTTDDLNIITVPLESSLSKEQLKKLSSSEFDFTLEIFPLSQSYLQFTIRG